MAASGKGDGPLMNAGKKRARKRTADQAALEGSDSTTAEGITSPEPAKNATSKGKSSPKKKVKQEAQQEAVDNDTINDAIDFVIKHGSPPAAVPQTSNNGEEVSPKKKAARKKKAKTEVKVEAVDETTGDSSEHTAISPDDEIWTTENVKALLERIKAELPKEDKSKYSTQCERMDWEKIKFEHFTAEDCKQKWNAVVLRLRRYRTMTDLVQDAEEWAKVPWSWFGKKKAHPDMPRRPLSPYLRFFMEKVPRYRKDYPNLAITAIAKMIAEKFKALPAKKKQKYTDGFNVENEVYKTNVEKFRDEHPDLMPNKGSAKPKKSPNAEKKEKVEGDKAPVRPVAAQQLFVNAKMEEVMINQPQLTKAEAIQELKKKWVTLKSSKKMKYINLALDGQKTYQTELDLYCKDHPEFQPKPHRAVLTKAEEKVRDLHYGKPEKPPNSGYAYFSSTLLSQLKELPSTERMGEISRRWKGLSEKERDKYNKQAEQKMRQYKVQFEKYMAALPEEEVARLEKEEALKASKKSPKTNGVVTPCQPTEPRPKRPMSALFMFINEKKDKFKQRYPNISNQNIVRLLSKAYSELPDTKREKYKKKELEQKEVYEQELQEYLKQHPDAKTGKENNRLKLRYPGEPKKPPGSGYQLFSAEMMGKLTDIPSKLRLQEVSARWKSLPELEKVGYNQRRVQMVDDYRIAVEKFKATLSLEEKYNYEEMVKQRGRKGAGNKGGKKVNNNNIKEEEKESEESESEASGSEEEASSSEEGSEEEGEEESSEEEEEESSDEEEEDETTTPAVNNSFPVPAESAGSAETNGAEEKESSSGSESESESSDSSSSGESSSEEGESD